MTERIAETSLRPTQKRKWPRCKHCLKTRKLHERIRAAQIRQGGPGHDFVRYEE